MAKSSVNSLKHYVLPSVTFTFSGAYYAVGNIPADIKQRIIGIYISALGDNTGPVSVALSSETIYALGVSGTTITNMVVTVVYI